MATKKQMNYEAALAEVETIIRKMDNNTLGLDEMVEEVRRAKKLLAFCSEKLKKTEKEIKSEFSESES
ncbi:MAG: exodeoxyribonuclease VII small subunit [Prevotella sp.]|nr:exodeoxyribonuclease VII small subunit [Prevotellaceae bacterium]MDY3936695.1 exodeoxyribonuclease VII small subunit [Prevotella sp.]